MEFQIETDRLILREIQMADDEAMFELDADASVHKYLGNNPITSIDEARNIIANIRQQYIDNGIGRWAAVEKFSGNFIGWSGLKLIKEPENNRVNFYDVGYRFLPKYWGKGYATESGLAALDYGFRLLKLEEIIGTAHEEHHASLNALKKCGLKFIEKFQWKDITCDWLSITRAEWLSSH